jgi:formamidopyrimidine-DNA glycosylase
MPELPEVETVVRGLRKPVVGHTIVAAMFPAEPGRMTNIDGALFAARIAGQAVKSITRRAKYLLLKLDTDVLIVHLKMTGHLYVMPKDEENPFDRWLRVRFLLDDGNELRFSDSRKFGRVYLCASTSEVLPELGPEPLSNTFTLDMFRERLKKRSGVLKSLLLNQSFIAGVGNIYADEALHIAGLHPLRPANNLDEDETARLYHAIRQALRTGLRYKGASIGWYRNPDGQRGQSQEHLRAYRTHATKDVPCPVCGGPITSLKIGQRTAHFCAICQPA